MATTADLVAREPVVPGPDLTAYFDATEVTPIARLPLYPGPDLVAYEPGGWPFTAVAALEITGTLSVTLAGFTLTATGTVADQGQGGGGGGLLLLMSRRRNVRRRRR